MKELRCARKRFRLPAAPDARGGVPTTLYRIDDIPSKQKLYKIDINAQQNHLTGVALLTEKCNLQEEKETWLTRHDRDCGDLYGALPLARGLPVMLTEHYDRSPEKQLLKGRRGHVKSIVLDDREDSKFEGGVRYLRYRVVAMTARKMCRRST